MVTFDSNDLSSSENSFLSMDDTDMSGQQQPTVAQLMAALASVNARLDQTDMEGSQGPQSHGQESQGQVMEYILSQLRSMDERLAQQSTETRALHEHMSPEFHDVPQPTLTANTPSAVPPLAPQFPRIETPRAPEVEMTLGATRQRRRAAWVSQTERDRRFAAGLCRRCGADDHILRNCPFLPAQRPTGNVSSIQQPRIQPVLEPEQPATNPPEPEK